MVLGFAGEASAFSSTLEALRSRLSFKEVEFDAQADSFVQGVLSDDEKAWMEQLPGPVFADGAPVVGTIPTGTNNEPWTSPTYDIFGVDFHTACLKVTDAANTKRYQIPESVVKLNGSKNPSMKPGMYGLSAKSDPFSFSFADQRDPTQIYVSSEEQKWVFNDKFIRLDLKLATRNIYGFGERVKQFSLTEGAYESFNYGFGEPYDPATAGNQAYGTHPFVMFQGKDKTQFFGMYFHNSNAQVPIISYKTDEEATFTYITTGGIIEVYFFTHGSPQFILKQYHNLIGKPHLPPFWTMGFQQGSWSYETQNAIETMVQNYADAKIPLEAVWIDIPYMDKYADFSIDTTAFPSLGTFTTSMHAKNQKVVPILDAGLSADNLQDKYYKLAQTNKALIQSVENKDKFEGALTAKVWPTHTVFLDYFQKEAQTVWQTGISDLFAKFAFDGLWLDMNEATIFCDGECPVYPVVPHTPPKTPGAQCVIPTEKGQQWYCSWMDQSVQSTYYLPFVPGAAAAKDDTHYQWKSLDRNIISLNATHTDDKKNVYTEYDVHNLFGLMEQQTTFEFKGADKRRPFMLSRSTFASSGKYSSHWLGDNYREWKFMKYSVAGIYNMNMFGIPHTGADVCGFQGKKDDEMCGRWTQLSTFYPFARNHYSKTDCKGQSACTPAPSSEPFTLASPWKEVATQAIFDRLSAARHIYTQLAKVHKNGGSMFSPLFYYYPEDPFSYVDPESTFMVGEQIKVSPIFKANTEQYLSFFPKDVWVNLFDFSKVIDKSESATGQHVLLAPEPNHVNAHIRGGSVVPWQFNNGATPMMTTTEFFENGKISLIALLDKNGQAKGELMVDDGISQDSLDNQAYDYHEFQFQANTLKRWIVNQALDDSVKTQNRYLDQIILLNAEGMKDYDFACSINSNAVNSVGIEHQIAYTDADKTLRITPKKGVDVKFTDFTDIVFGKTGVHPNWCDPNTFAYELASDVNLDAPMAHFLLDHKAKLWPTVLVGLHRLENDSIEMEVNYLTTPNDYLTPFEPDIGTAPRKYSSAPLSDYVQAFNNPNFGITVGVQPQTVFDLKEFIMGMTDYFTRFSIKANLNPASPGIWGLGDHYSKSIFVPDGIYSQFNRDQPDPLETGKLPASNTYGTHPFWMFASGSPLPEAAFAGVFFKNVNAADFSVYNDKTNHQVTVTSNTAGGKVHFYFFHGKTADEVVSKYHSVIGYPVSVPRWALGWNQCQYGWKDVAAEQAVVKGYSDNKIPLDVMWSDIDYMHEYRDFTVGSTGYAGQGDYVTSLHTANIKYVPIVDAGVAYRPNETEDPYTFFNTAGDIWIKGPDGKPFVGRVWPNDSVWPDWSNPNAVKAWQAGITTLQGLVAFDGLWLDMNEASNFCNGACYLEQQSASPVKFRLPWSPTGRDIETKSISLDAMHSDGKTELDMHNMFSYGEVKATHEWFQAQKKRTMIISRASVAGQGKYGSRWLGDNTSDIEYLAISVPGIMNSNMYGIPLAGVDICGFLKDTTPELCARWTVIGAMYPFSRNHNDIHSTPQEPYVAAFNTEYEPGLTYTQIMAKGIQNKYAITRYLYSELMGVSKMGGQVYRPVFYSFPGDVNAWENPHLNWMIGNYLKLSANTEKLKQDTTSFYFPQGYWCNIFNDVCYRSSGASTTLSTKPYDIYAHLVEGGIVPWNDPSTVMNQHDLVTNHEVSFKINPGFEGPNSKLWRSSNELRPYHNDDGETIDPTDANIYNITAGTFDPKLPQRVTINIDLLQHASSVKTPTQGGCYKLNMGDMLGEIYIYNADISGMSLHSYNSFYVFADGSTDYFVDNVTIKDGVVKIGKRPGKTTCLGGVTKIALIPAF